MVPQKIQGKIDLIMVGLPWIDAEKLFKWQAQDSLQNTQQTFPWPLWCL